MGNTHSLDITGTLTEDLAENLAKINAIMGKNNEMIQREIIIGGKYGQTACFLYLDGLIDKRTISDFILKPLQNIAVDEEKITLENISKSFISTVEIEEAAELKVIINRLINGFTVLLLEGNAEALLIETRGWEKRSITEPSTEVVVRGPREGFVENLQTNIALLRRKLKHPDFTLERFVVGRYTQTNVAVVYLRSLADPNVVKEVKKRIEKIDIDGIFESGYIEQLIEDNPYSVFATVGNSEKPDKVAAKMLEGRVAIMVDGSPIVLTVPLLFVETMQSSEDYYSRPYYAAFVRLIRYISLFVSVWGPGIYVAIICFHQELLPYELSLTISTADINTPFNAVLGIFILGIIYEILREAGVRLPRPAGEAVSIVGALVIGQTAVAAGIISAPVVIVVAGTAIASFVTNPLTDSGTMYRIIFLILAGVLGGFGILIGSMFFFGHLLSLKSFGVPYLAPILPTYSLRDTIVRFPLWMLDKRPTYLATSGSKHRQAKNQKPAKEAKT